MYRLDGGAISRCGMRRLGEFATSCLITLLILLSTRELVRVLSGHHDIVTHLAVVHDGWELVSAGLDGLVKLWVLDGGSVRDVGPAGQANVLAMAVQGECVFLGRGDSTVSIVNVTSGQLAECVDATVGEAIWKVGFVGDSPMVVYYQEGRAMVNIYQQS